MSDLIDRQAALEGFKKACAVEVIEQHGWPHSEIRTCLTYGGIEKILNSVPSADAVEVRHGTWIEDRYNNLDYVCSECGEPCAGMVMGKPRDRYCKWCGAKMGGDQDGSEG